MNELIHIKCLAWYVAPGKDSKKKKKKRKASSGRSGRTSWEMLFYVAFSLVRINTKILNCLIFSLVCLVEI